MLVHDEIAATETGAEVSSYARNEDGHNLDPRDEETLGIPLHIPLSQNSRQNWICFLSITQNPSQRVFAVRQDLRLGLICQTSVPCV
jgi:hypothetical protein